VTSSKTMNPYGVGWRGATVHERKGRCECCALEFLFQAPPDGVQRRCQPCVDHLDGGTPAEQIAVLTAHAEAYRARADKAHAMVAEAMEAKTRAEDEVAECRRQVAAALQSRDRHRAIQLAVMNLHHPGADGICQCGERSCPEQEAANQAAAQIDQQLYERGVYRAE
jgi:hypothetical protein